MNYSTLKEGNCSSFRAVIIGSFLGGIMTISNMYLGFKTGFNIFSGIFSAIMSFIIFKNFPRKLSRLFGNNCFGPKENAIAQSVTVAVSAPCIIYTSAIPAVYHLNIFSENLFENLWKFMALVVCASFYGLFIGTGFRELNILKLKYIFPIHTALAFTI